jgi:hypothetical protein
MFEDATVLGKMIPWITLWRRSEFARQSSGFLHPQ